MVKITKNNFLKVLEKEVKRKEKQIANELKKKLAIEKRIEKEKAGIKDLKKLFTLKMNERKELKFKKPVARELKKLKNPYEYDRFKFATEEEKQKVKTTKKVLDIIEKTFQKYKQNRLDRIYKAFQKTFNPLELDHNYQIRSNFGGKILMYVFKSDISFIINKEWIANQSKRQLTDVHELYAFLDDIKKIIISYLEKNKGMRFNISIMCTFIRYRIKNDKIILENEFNCPFNTKSIKIINIESIDEIINEQINDLIKRINEYEGMGSNFVLKSINSISINSIKFNPLGEAKYISLPQHIANKKCCINIQNEDNECFKYCALYHENKENIKIHPERVSNYKNIKTNLKFDGLEFPLKLQDIDKFEKMNNISVNVFRHDIDTEKIIKRLTNNYIKKEILKENEKMSTEELLKYE